MKCTVEFDHLSSPLSTSQMGTTRTIIPRWTYSHGGFVSLEERVSDASVRVLNLHQSLLQTTSADVISEYLSKISSTFLVTDKVPFRLNPFFVGNL